jgi:hypothetical protein
LKDQIEYSTELLKKLDIMLGRYPLHKYFSLQKEKLQNLKNTVNNSLEQGKEMNILYRGKPKIITIINKYTKNDKEYAVITDHTDNDKTKTLFTSYIEIVN